MLVSHIVSHCQELIGSQFVEFHLEKNRLRAEIEKRVNNWHRQVEMLALPVVPAALHLTWWLPQRPWLWFSIGFGGTLAKPFGQRISRVHLSFKSSSSCLGGER